MAKMTPETVALIVAVARKTGLNVAVVRTAVAWRSKACSYDPAGWEGLTRLASHETRCLLPTGREAQAALRIELRTCQEDGYFCEMATVTLEGPKGEAILGHWENA